MKDQKLVSQNEYHVVDILGEGSTSVVYQAIKKDRSESIKTEIALKVFSSEEHIDVWKREFDSLLKVNSSYCVRVFNFEWVSNKPALCLELVEGLTLVELLDSQSLSEDHLLEVSAQALQGLRDLWLLQLCHGDLSPKNIMVTSEGQVKLLDFGLGNFDEKVRRGTPFFVHQSLVDGEGPSEVSDLFSLGRLMNWSGQRLINSSEKLHELGSELAENPNASSSTLKKLEESDEQRRALAQVVKSELERKRAVHTKTEEFMLHAESFNYEGSSDKNGVASGSGAPWKQKLVRGAFAILLTVAVLAAVLKISELKTSDRSAKRLPATLEIRTNSWKEIWVDGKRKGYTPAKLGKLTPGKHLLKWASPDGSGQLILTLEPGENRLLTDKDLVDNGE
ncbi:MAG: protein kinase [Pseudomonadota bacterium]